MSPTDDELPRVLRVLWQQDPAPRRAGTLTRAAIVAAAIDIADAEGLAGLSMARVAQRLGCGTMSLYRHIANKDELVAFMASAAPGEATNPPDGADWRAALQHWAFDLWDVYHRHPWILQAVSVGPPLDPGQLAWLDTALAGLSGTALTERDKLTAVVAVLQYVRGAAALAIDARGVDEPDYSNLLRRLVSPDRFPALAEVIAAGVFDAADEPHQVFRSGLDHLLDGIADRIGGGC